MTDLTLHDVLKPKRTNRRKPGANPPGREYLRAPWIEGAEPKRWEDLNLLDALEPLQLKPRTEKAVVAVLAWGMSYKEAAEKLGETSSYVRNAVISTAEKLGGRAWMYAPKAQRCLVIENVPPELHDTAKQLVRELVEKHRRKVVPLKPSK